MNRQGLSHSAPSTLLSAAVVLLLSGFCPAQSQPSSTPPSPPATPPPAATTPTLFAAADPDQEIVVVTRDGQRFSGMLVRATADELVLKISGIQTRVEMVRVDKYEVLPPLMDRYRDLRAAMGDDADQIVQLAEWLRVRDKFEFALSEVQRALAVDPTNGEGLRLKTLLEQQIILKMKARPTAVPGGGEEQDQPPAQPDPHAKPHKKPPEFPLLTPEQVNLLKVYELDLKQNPRVVVPYETVKRMLDEHVGHPLVPTTREGREAIMRKDPVEILDLMFRLQARNLYSQIQVVDPPPAMIIFREHVERTWLLNSCATNQCHGGQEAGRLALFNRRPNSDASVYTNFFILNSFRLADGTSLINWDNPDRSPLLQMGLPSEDSLFPHPSVIRGPANADAWKPVFKSAEDKQFEQAIEWLKAMYRPRPEYPVKYAPIRPFEAPPKNPPPQPQPAAQAPASPAPAAPSIPAGSPPPASTEPPPR